MEVDNPSCLEEKEIIVFPFSEVTNEEHFTLEQNFLNKSNNKTSNKRRLVITTMSIEPILIEIRPNLSKIHPLISNSTQCNIIENECHCNETLCLEHTNLWNEFNQIIHDSNTFKFFEDHWFEKEAKVSIIDEAKRINCRELWPNIFAKALESIKYFKKEIEKERDEREKYAMALTKFGDLEEQFEMEKHMRNEECHKYNAIILELRTQVTKQAEEIRRLWTENLAIESDSVNLKLDENKHQEDVLETKQRLLELEDQLIKKSKKHQITLLNQEAKCDFFQLKIDQLENKQVAILLDKNKCDDLKLKIEELEKENLQYQEEVILSTFRKDGDDKILDYASLLKEYEILKEEHEKTNNNYNRTTNKLRHNVAKRRRLEAESEGEKQQRSNLAAAIYELESEVEATVSIISSLQSTTFENMSTLTLDLQKFKEMLEKCVAFNDSKMKSPLHNDNDIVKSIDNVNEQNLVQNFKAMNSNMDIFKGIPDTKPIISKLIEENEKLLNEISNVRIAIRQALKSQKCEMHANKKEMMTKLETIEAEKEVFHQKTKILDEENKILEDENSKLRHEISTLKFAKTKLTLEVKDLDKEMEDLQENLKDLREENRKLLKEAKWKSVGKQGGYQESLIVQEWEKKLKKLEEDYEILRHEKKNLVKEKHRLEDELDKAVEKGYKGLVGSEDRKLEDELFSMIQERNKLRKIKITLAIENVSLKEALFESKTKVDALQIECKTLQEWKEKVKKLEEDCEDLRDWKKKAEALEIECEEFRNNQIKVEAHEIEFSIKKNSKIKELDEECQNIHDVKKIYKDILQNDDVLKEECKKLRECKIHLKKGCQKLCQSVDHLDKESNTLCECKEMINHTNENDDSFDANKLKIKILECEKFNDNSSNIELQQKNKILQESNSFNVETCNIQDYFKKIESLEDENMRLCENHQAALDKQWNVLQADLKAFEAKIEELESECESIRRDHLSSMVENAELAREKDKLFALYNEQKYNYEILETANECLQKNQEQREAQQMSERNDYHASIDKLHMQILELESTFCERLHQEATNYASCLALKTKIDGQETITLTYQEYEILLAEKATMLQERDSAHKKLCSVEIHNLQLNAIIECLRQEILLKKQGYDEKEPDAEVLLAQDVVNLRSMLSSLDEELRSTNYEKNKMLDVNMSLKKEFNEAHEALSRYQIENQNLNIALEELNKRSSLEQIHSAASSLKEQLGKVSKEKDSIKEQLNKAIKEKEQVTNVANERDNVILSLKENIVELQKEKEETYSSFKIQLQNMEDNRSKPSHIQDQLMIVIKERDNIKEELNIHQRKLESLYSKMSLMENEQTKKTKLRQKEQDNFENKFKKIEKELYNTKEALAMTEQLMQNDKEKEIKEKNNLEMVVKKEIEDAHAQKSQLNNELIQTKQCLCEKINIASKDINNIVDEKNIIAQELKKCKEMLSLLQKENERLINLIQEKDNVISTKLSHINEQNHLLALIANLKNEKEIMTKKFEQNLHIEMPSMKTMLATTVKEKEELITNKECLQKTNNDLCVMVKSLNEQLVILSNGKDQFAHAKEGIVLEQNDLLEKISIFNKQDNIKFINVDLNSKGQANGGLKVCETILKDQIVENDLCSNSIEKGTIQTQVREMKIQYNALIDANSTLMKEKECLIEELNSSLKEILLLKKNNAIKHEKNEECQWNFKRSKEEIANLSHDKEQLLASQASLKQQLIELEKMKTNTNFSSMNEKMTLLQDRDNLVVEITLLKKEKNEIKKKIHSFLVQDTTPMKDLQNALTATKHELLSKQKEHAKLMEDYVQLKVENETLIQTKGSLTKEHNNLIIEIRLIKEENEDLEKRLTNEMVQLPVLRSKLIELSSEKDQLAASELCSTQQFNMLQAKTAAHEQSQSRLEGELNVLHEVRESLIQENDELVKKCEQQVQLQNELSSLSKVKETLFEEYDNLSKKMTILYGEKELLAEKYTATLIEKDQVLASQLSQQVEVDSLNKALFSLNQQNVDLIQKNKNMQIKLQSIITIEAKISKDQEQQTYESTLFDTNEVAILCNIDQYENQMDIKFSKENNQSTIALSPITTIFSNDELKSLKKQLECLKQQQSETNKERDNIASSLKEKEQACNNAIISYKMEVETLKEKLDLFNQQQVQVFQEKEDILQENKLLQQQCNNLQAKISTLKVEGDIMNSSAESEITKHDVFKEQFQKHEIVSLQTSVKTLKEQQTNLTKENMEIALENEVLTKERDCLFASISSLKKQYEAICVQELKKKDTTIIEASLKKKFEDLVQIVNALNQSKNNHALQKEILTEIPTSSKKEHFNLLEIVQLSNKYQVSSCLTDEHHSNKEINHFMVVNKEEINKLQASLKVKLDDLAKTTTSLIQNCILSMKEKEHLVLEITCLKQECQKLHVSLINSEKDKDILMKKVMESRSTFDRLIGEISRLQRESSDVEMKLGRTIVEKDNAKVQIAELQMLFSNQQRMQHLPNSYSIEKVQTLEAQNRCLRMEKDVLEECLNKRSVEFDRNHQFKQQSPSITNFNCTNQQPPSHHLVHTSSQLYLSGSNASTRPQPSFPPMLHQQWPMVTKP